MDEGYLLSLGQKTLIIFIQLAVPILGFSLVTGLLVSIFQAVTQIQDVTLSFVPKIVAVVIAVVIFGPWMLRGIVNFTYHLMVNLAILR